MFRRLLCVFLISCPLFAADSPLRDRNEPYRIHPSDQLQLTYRYTPEYDQSLTVQPDPHIDFRVCHPRSTLSEPTHWRQRNARRT